MRDRVAPTPCFLGFSRLPGHGVEPSPHLDDVAAPIVHGDRQYPCAVALRIDLHGPDLLPRRQLDT